MTTLLNFGWLLLCLILTARGIVSEYPLCSCSITIEEKNKRRNNIALCKFRDEKGKFSLRLEKRLEKSTDKDLENG